MELFTLYKPTPCFRKIIQSDSEYNKKYVRYECWIPNAPKVNTYFEKSEPYIVCKNSKSLFMNFNISQGY